MSEIELAPLSHRLDEEEIRALSGLLEQAGAPRMPKSDEHAAHRIAGRLAEDALTEFVDRLDAHDIGAEIYLPIEFEGRVTVGEFRVASAQSLAEVLEEMKEELGVTEKESDEDEDEDEEDEADAEDEDEGTVIEAQLRHIWSLMADGATECLEKSLPLHVQI